MTDCLDLSAHRSAVQNGTYHECYPGMAANLAGRGYRLVPTRVDTLGKRPMHEHPYPSGRSKMLHDHTEDEDGHTHDGVGAGRPYQPPSIETLRERASIDVEMMGPWGIDEKDDD